MSSQPNATDVAANSAAIVDMNGTADYVTVARYAGGTTIGTSADVTNFSGAMLPPKAAAAAALPLPQAATPNSSSTARATSAPAVT